MRVLLCCAAFAAAGWFVHEGWYGLVMGCVAVGLAAAASTVVSPVTYVPCICCGEPRRLDAMYCGDCEDEIAALEEQYEECP